VTRPPGSFDFYLDEEDFLTRVGYLMETDVWVPANPGAWRNYQRNPILVPWTPLTIDQAQAIIGDGDLYAPSRVVLAEGIACSFPGCEPFVIYEDEEQGS
jgi:hypothetical protein